MIVNANTSSHDFYQRDLRKTKPKKERRQASPVSTPRCQGTLEEKLAWMRARQEAKKRGGLK